MDEGLLLLTTGRYRTPVMWLVVQCLQHLPYRDESRAGLRLLWSRTHHWTLATVPSRSTFSLWKGNDYCSLDDHATVSLLYATVPLSITISILILFHFAGERSSSSVGCSATVILGRGLLVPRHSSIQ